MTAWLTIIYGTFPNVNVVIYCRSIFDLNTPPPIKVAGEINKQTKFKFLKKLHNEILKFKLFFTLTN